MGIITTLVVGLIVGAIAKLLVPGRDPAHFAYVNTTVHRNLYRISLQ